jgi:hypothetical protein
MFARGARTGMLFLAASACMWAQGEVVSARLTGTVLDAAEAAVPGARVTLSGPDVGLARQWLTSADGHYVFASIPPGRYQLKVEKQGFKTYLNLNIVMAVGQASDFHPKLEVGAISQVIEVTGNAPLLNVGNANIGWEVSTSQLTELPLNLRNVFSLTLLSSSVNNGHQYQGFT